MRLLAGMVLALVLCTFVFGCGGKTQQPQGQPSQVEVDDSNPNTGPE